MGRKSSDASSGVGAELLNALRLNKYMNNTDDSDLAEEKNNKNSKFNKFKKLSKEKKKKKSNIKEPNDMEIDLKNEKDNREIEQASEKKAVSSLIDVQLNFESQLEEFEKSMENIKKNVNEAESCLENIYISVDKLEKFVELCNVENADVILGLHKLVNVHKGAALLSTFSEDPTFKKNYEYNINDPQEGKNERKFINTEDSNLNNDNSFKNLSNEKRDINNQISDNKVENISVKSEQNGESNNQHQPNKQFNNQNFNEITLDDSFNFEDIHDKTKNNLSKQDLSNNDNNNNSKSPKEGKISKTEKFKEKLDNLRIKKSKKYQSNEENNDVDPNEDATNTRHKRMEKLRQKFDKRRHSNN